MGSIGDHRDVNKLTLNHHITSNKIPSVIPFHELEPSWHVPSAKVPGFMRWLVSWVGGPEGFVNPNLGRAIVGNKIGVGYMYLPIGQRQEGLHYHSITEIYIILKGQVQSYEGLSGESTLAGPMDCVYIPKGVPHGVRNCGTEDVELLWLHDGIEAKGVTVYCHTQEDLQQAPSQEPIVTISLKDLEPCWDLPRAKEPEFLRWVVNWVGGPQGHTDYNQTVSIKSGKMSLGMTTILPGHKQPVHSHEVGKVYVVVGGKGLVNYGEGIRQLGYLDGVYLPPHTGHSLRNHGTQTLRVVWALESIEKSGSVTYH